MTDDFSEQPSFGLSDLPPEMPDDEAFQNAAKTVRRSVLGGRDAPDPFETNVDAASLASIGASFIPGAGLLELFGYMPDFRGGYEPSLLKNLRQRNYASGGLQIASVMVPFVGSLRKAARATAGARRLAKRERIFDDINPIRRAEGEVAQFDLPRQSPGVISDDLANLFATPGLEEQMLAKIEAGKRAGALNWYNTEPLRQVFLKELGPEEGEQAFRKYMRYVAATSPVSDVGTNARNASYYFGMDAREGRLPARGEKLPRPYDHPKSWQHRIYAGKDFEDEADQFAYQKMSSMYQNLIGNYAPVTVDMHALRLPAMLAKDKNFLSNIGKDLLARGFSMDQLAKIPKAWRRPKPEEYAAIEQFYKRLAKKAGLTPGQAQGAAWVGGADLTDVRDNGLLSFMQHFEDRLHLTADKLKIPAAEVLRRFVRGQVNLASIDGQQNAVG